MFLYICGNYLFGVQIKIPPIALIRKGVGLLIKLSKICEHFISCNCKVVSIIQYFISVYSSLILTAYITRI